jgi:hypothetical protein
MSVAATNYVWTKSPAEGADRLVLLALADFADEMGNCFGSWGKLCEKTRLARRTVADCLKRLQKAGQLVLVERGSRKVAGSGLQASIWTIPGVAEMGADAAPKSERWVQEMHPSGANAAPKWCNPCTPTIDNIKNADSAVAPAASQPSLPSSSAPLNSAPKKRKSRPKAPHPTLRPDLDDQSWFRHLSELPEFAHAKIAEEYGRCRTWCRNKGVGAVSRRRFINWLSKVEAPLTEPTPQVVRRSAADDYYARIEARVGGIKA